MHFIIKLNPNYSFYWLLHGCLELCAVQHTWFTQLLYDHLYKVIAFVAKLRAGRHLVWALSQHAPRLCWKPQDSSMHSINTTSSIHQLNCSAPHRLKQSADLFIFSPPPTSSIHCKQSYRGGEKKKAINRREAEDDELREPPLIFHFDRLSSVKRQRRCSSYTELGSSLFVAQTYVFRMN